MKRRIIMGAADHISEEALSESATKLVSPGAVLIVVRSGILKHSIPAAINRVAVALNQDMKALHPGPEFEPRYLLWLIEGNQTNLISEWTKQGATVESIEHELLANSLFTVPPLGEQHSIVRFLDHVDRLIQRYVNAKRRLFRLLEEQKQAVIHRAVTRGLDPNVRLKPSGVQWLDHMPAHWHRRSLGTCLQKIEQGWSPVAAGGDLVPGQWAVLTLSAVKRGIFNLSVKPIQMLEGNPSSIEIKDGDLLLTRSNTRGLVGDVCIIDGARPKTFFSDLIYRISVNSTVLEKRFLMYQLLSSFGRYQIERDARGSSGTMPKIGQQHIKAWQVLIPPGVEQQQIVSTIDSSTRRISIAISALGNHVALLREYRTRLIADVVTGKLDVREAAARLPDEVEDAQTAEPIEGADALTDRKAAEEDSEAASEEALEEALA